MTDSLLLPEMRAVMTRLARYGPSRYDLPFAEARVALLEQRRWWQQGAPPMRLDETVSIASGPRTIMLRRLVPARARDDRVVIFLHGGGWCVGSNATHHAPQSWLAAESDCEVIGVDYSLAPEHPFPAAIEDTRAAVDWVMRERPGRKVVLAGDSAGANLALVEALRRRDAAEPNVARLILLYGCYAPVSDAGSYRQFGGGAFGLSSAAMQRYLSAYAPAADPTEWRVYPLAANLQSLPPLTLFAAECDPLADDSRALAAAVRAAGGEVVLKIFPGVVHGFIAYWRMLGAAREVLADAGGAV